MTDSSDGKQDQSKEWHVEIQGEQAGPMSLDEVRDLVGEGKIDASSLVWKKGMEDWKPLGEVPALSEATGEAGQTEAPSEGGVMQFLRQFLGDGGMAKVEALKHRLNAPALGSSTDMTARSFDMQAISRAEAVQYTVQFAQAASYTIQRVDEEEGKVTLTKKTALNPRYNFVVKAVEASETDTRIEIEVQGRSSIGRKQELRLCLDGLKKFMFAAKYGGPAGAAASLSDSKGAASSESPFLRGMNEGCGCIASGVLVLFLLWLLGVFLTSL